MAADKDARAAKFKFRTDGREGKQAGITQRAADFIRIYAGVFSGCSCCCLQQRRGCNYFGPRGEIKRGERNKGAMPRVKDVYGEREYEIEQYRSNPQRLHFTRVVKAANLDMHAARGKTRNRRAGVESIKQNSSSVCVE